MALVNTPTSGSGTPSSTTLKPVGVVKFVSGEAIAVNASGVVCRLQPGDKIFPNDIIQTSKEGSVQIEFFSGSVADLGRNHSMLIDDELFSMATLFAPAKEEAEASGTARKPTETASTDELPREQSGGQTIIDVTPTSSRIQVGANTGNDQPGQSAAVPGSAVQPTALAAPGTISATYTDTGILDGITNNPNLSIAATSGINITSVVANGPSGSVSFSLAGGQWTPSVPLADGGYVITVAGTNAAGQPLHASASYTLDTSFQADPHFAFGSFANNAQLNTATPTIAGTATAGTTLAIEVHSEPQHFTVIANPDGSWSIVPQALEDGTHTLDITQYDSVGNSQVLHFDFEVDATAPTISLGNIVIAADNVINGTEAAGTISLTGTYSAIDDYSGVDTLVVKLEIGGGTYSGTVDGAGHFLIENVPAAALLGAGSVTVTLEATDDFGNVTTIDVPQTFSVDLGTTVTVADIATNGAGYTNQATQTIGGTAEAGSVITVKEGGTVIGTTSTASDGSWSLSGVVFPDGDHQLTVIATDAAGNESVSVSNSFKVDATPPAAASIALSNDTGSSGSDHITSDGTLVISDPAPEVTRSFSINGGAAAASYAPPTADGTYTILVTDTDPAGNQTASSFTFTRYTGAGAVIAVDPITPDNIVNAAEAGSTVTVTGHVEGDAEPGDTVSFTLNGHAYSGSVAADRSFSIEVAGSDLAAQTSLVATVSGTDGGGAPFAASATVNYAVDTSSPGTPAIATIVTDDATPTLNGTAEAGAIVRVSIDGAVIGEAVAQADGSWSLTSAALTTGTHQVTAVAVDAAGNTSASSSATLGIVSDGGYLIPSDSLAAVIQATAVGGDASIRMTVSDSSGEHVAEVTIKLDRGNHTLSVPMNGFDVYAGETYSLTMECIDGGARKVNVQEITLGDIDDLTGQGVDVLLKDGTTLYTYESSFTGDSYLGTAAGIDVHEMTANLDDLVGTDAIDVIRYGEGDLGGAGDTIANFEVGAGGDVLDLHDLLGTGGTLIFDSVVNHGDNTATVVLSVDTDGAAAAENSTTPLATITLTGIDPGATTDQIIDQLLQNGEIKT